MPLENKLDANEARVFGVLIEKSLTTPDQYPLSINGATAGSNQKNNRHPAMSLTEGEVETALARLVVNGLAGRVSPIGSRVEKYRHNGEEVLGLEPAKLAVLAELLCRGPQTKGELRTRVNRMRPMPDLAALEAHLVVMEKDGWIRPIPPAPGSRAGRFVQTIAPGIHGDEPASVPTAATPAAQPAPAPIAATPASNADERFEKLEAEVRALRSALEQLAEKLGEPLN